MPLRNSFGAGRVTRGVLALVAVGVPLAADAQSVEVGARAGVTSSSVVWETPGPISSRSNRSRRGLAAGVFARWRLTPGFSVQPELLVVQKGFERTQPTHHFTYLELPLLARADFGGRRLRGFVLGGPAVAYELACQVSFVWYGFGPYSGDCDAPSPAGLTTATYAWDASAVLGGGVTLRVGAGRLIADARYTHGIRDVGLAQPSGQMLNRSVALTAGYEVPFSR